MYSDAAECGCVYPVGNRRKIKFTFKAGEQGPSQLQSVIVWFWIIWHWVLLTESSPLQQGSVRGGNCSEVDSLAILVCASVPFVFRRALDLTSWSNMTLPLTHATNVIITAVTSMFPCPATTVAMHLFTSPCTLWNVCYSTALNSKGRGRRRGKVLQTFKNGYSSVSFMHIIMWK